MCEGPDAGDQATLIMAVPIITVGGGTLIKRGSNHRFEVTIDTSDLSQHVDRLNVSTERLMAGMILAGMLIGGAIAMVAVPQTEIGIYIKLATFAVFVIAAGLGL